MSKYINYIPHNKFNHYDTRRTEEDFDDAMLRLSTIVGHACDKWLAARGIKSNQFAESVKYNKKLQDKNI